MDGVFELETRYSRVEVWEKDALEEIDVIIGFTGDTLSVSLSSEQADAVAVALIQATPVSVSEVSDKIMMLPRDTRDGVYALTSEQRRALGLALIRSAR